jgi:Uma2 family endonuclease
MQPHVTEVPNSAERRLPMTYEEYRAWQDEGAHGEWVNGEVIIFMSPKDIHQAIIGFLYTLMKLYTDLLGLGEVRVAPLEMRARLGGPAREPDIFFVARERHDLLTNDRLNGPADLTIEVISDESAARDRTDKFYEYQDSGVREYWIIDPRPGKQRIDLYTLLEDGRYQAIIPDAQGWYHSVALLNFRLRAEWFWQEQLPEPLTALAAVRGLSPETLATIRSLLLGNQG